MSLYKKIERKIQHYLSHYPLLYALIVGIGIVLFWRGVWHTADNIHTAIHYFYSDSTTVLFAPWWDGPLSFIIGSMILYTTGAFTSSFIGNELILSGLRGERKLSERTEADVKDEEHIIGDIKEELGQISSKIEMLEKQAIDNHENF